MCESGLSNIFSVKGCVYHILLNNKKKKIFSFIETKLFIYILDGSLWISAYLLNREASPRVYVYLCMCVRVCTSVCVCVVYVYLSPLIAPLSLTGPGKRVCVVSAAPVDWPYFWLQATWARGGTRPQRLSPPDLRGLRQPRQWSPDARGRSPRRRCHENSNRLSEFVLNVSFLHSFIIGTVSVKGKMLYKCHH